MYVSHSLVENAYYELAIAAVQNGKVHFLKPDEERTFLRLKENDECADEIKLSLLLAKQLLEMSIIEKGPKHSSCSDLRFILLTLNCFETTFSMLDTHLMVYGNERCRQKLKRNLFDM